VPGILPEGLTLLCGKPKKGKSLLSCNIALAVASGGRVLGKHIEQGSVIALCLEDTPRRLQSRLTMMLQYDELTAQAMENLRFINKSPCMPDGIQLLKQQIVITEATGREVRLIIIDTLAKFRPHRDALKSGYGTDYDDLGQIKELSDLHHVPILLIHHLRKSGADDIMDTVSGSLGLTGAADSILILDRGSGTADASLHVTGRDIEEAEHALQLDKATLTWQHLGSAEEVRSTTGQQTIVDTLKASDEAMSPRDIETITGLDNQYIRKTLLKLQKDKIVKKYSYGKYLFTGNSGNTEYTGNTGNTGNTSRLTVATVPTVATLSIKECTTCKKNYQCLDCEHGAKQQAINQ